MIQYLCERSLKQFYQIETCDSVYVLTKLTNAENPCSAIGGGSLNFLFNINGALIA